jgi:hypothetical protein
MLDRTQGLLVIVMVLVPIISSLPPLTCVETLAISKSLTSTPTLDFLRGPIAEFQVPSKIRAKIEEYERIKGKRSDAQVRRESSQ